MQGHYHKRYSMSGKTTDRLAPRSSDERLIPFVIGVTGHRDLRATDTPALEATVRDSLLRLQSHMPNTPLVVLSALAPGADQLVARVATELGLEIAAVRAMPVEACFEDMPKGSQTAFVEGYNTAYIQIDLPCAPTLAELKGSADLRRGQYEVLARFLASHCQTLIALWDGEDSDRLGGTARVVRYAGGDWPTDTEQAYDTQTVLVRHVMAPREGSGGAEAGNLQLRGAGLEAKVWGEEPADFVNMRRCLDDYNRDAVSGLGPMAQYPGGIAQAALNGNRFAEQLCGCYGAADRLSQHYASWTWAVLWGLLLIAMLGVTSFVIYAHIFPRHFLLWFLYPAALGWAAAVHWLGRWKRVESRFLDYRALAEGLRVQLFWRMTGVADEVADHYLRHHRTELDWIRHALRAMALVGMDRKSGEVRPRPEAEALSLTMEHWVKDQRNFFDSRWPKRDETVRTFERRAKWALWIAGVLSTAIPASLLAQAEWLSGWRELANDEKWLGVMLLVASFPPALAALGQVWVTQRGTEEEARSYHKMSNVMKRGEARIAARVVAKDWTAAREEVRQLGLEALGENGDWLVLHRNRPLKVVG